MLRAETEHDYQQTLLSRTLRKCFGDDHAEMIAAIEAGADYRHLASGETLFHEGDVGDEVYFVLSGRLRAFTVATEGEARILGEVGRGETIGELAVLTGEPRSATVVALRETMVARVSRPLIEQIMARTPGVALRLTRLVVERFRKADETRPQSTAVNICILPITRGIDAHGFADALRLQQPASARPIAVLDATEFSTSLDATAPSRIWRRHGVVPRYLDEIEEENAAVYLVADGEDTTWTRFCLQHADEVLLLADATHDPALSEVEVKLLGSAPVTIARQTLVLLHDETVQSPRGTKRWLAPRGKPRHFHLRPRLSADMARMARIVSGRAVGLVLAGGGARGFAHIGVYEALEAAGVEIDFIGGTSIGALMGTLMALDVRSGPMKQGVREAFLKHPKGNITGDFNLLPLLSLIKGGRSRDALVRSVQRHAGAEIDMEDSWKTFFVMASNFSEGRETVLKDGSLVESVTASFAIPGALPPVLMEGQLLFDGGTFNNFPVDVMASLGVGKVIGVDLSTDFGKRLEVPSIPGTLALLRDRLRPRHKQHYRRLPSMPETMLMSSFVTSLSRQREQRQQADLLFRPTLPRMGLLDWHRFEQVVEAGRAHAAEILGSMSETALAEYR